MSIADLQTPIRNAFETPNDRPRVNGQPSGFVPSGLGEATPIVPPSVINHSQFQALQEQVAQMQRMFQHQQHQILMYQAAIRSGDTANLHREGPRVDMSTPLQSHVQSEVLMPTAPQTPLNDFPSFPLHPPAFQPMIQRTGDIPKAPVWTGGGLAERKQMLLKYEAYVKQCHAASTPTNQIVPIAISMCMDSCEQEFISRFEWNMDPAMMTDNHFIEYFRSAVQSKRESVADIVRLVKSEVTMITGSRHAGDVMTRWKRSYFQLLEKYSYQQFSADHPKEAIKALIETIKPNDVRELVRNDMEGEFKPRNRELGTFFALVHNRLETRFAFYTMRNESAAKDVKTTENTAGSGYKKSSPSMRKAQRETTSRPERSPDSLGDGRGPLKNRFGKEYTCLNKSCDGKHNVFHCPKTTYREAQQLMSEWHASTTRQKQLRVSTVEAASSVSTNSPASTEAPTTVTITDQEHCGHQKRSLTKKVDKYLKALRQIKATDAGTCRATVEGCLELEAVLWDSGADQPVVTRGLLEALAKKGVCKTTSMLDDPMRFEDFQGGVLEVKETVQLDEVVFHTSAGRVAGRR
ncbi:hypothetical protein LEN26_002398 [Aphanomyces euteiches]|nr:hypothetical protein AeMF1_012068 [Aphanomyces euteiches]KAH9159320.1 hypothetical protein LEN26_002398 [Aphanomyces euteiches]KAH9187991.1 hypothetical protein AeNC1_010034 [Aphanomyces euteiches]